MAIKFSAITMLQLKILINMFVLQMLLIDMTTVNDKFTDPVRTHSKCSSVA